MKRMPDLSRFRESAFVSLITLVTLLAPVVLSPDGDDARLSAPLRSLHGMRKPRVPREEEDQVMAGYYEDLFSFSSRTIATNRLITGRWATNWSKYELVRVDDADETRLQSFLYYEMKPNLNRKEFDGQLITNRFGMSDREYTKERPEGARRIAVIGDSITQGAGTTFGKDFEFLLEDRMNALHPVPGIDRYEFLNFSVRGYHITQELWVLDRKAAEFHPQVYVVVLTHSALRNWADHIVQLVHDGIDLQYPYLKELAAKAALRPDDDPQTFAAKLAPHHTEFVRGTLEAMRTSARAQGADLIVWLVPGVLDDSGVLAQFVTLKALIDRLGIPVVDVTDTFAGIEDPRSWCIRPGDTHPNDAGHALLADRIFARLRANSRAWALVSGAPAQAQ